MIIDFIQTVDDCKREEKDPEGIFKLEVDNKLTIMAWLQQKKDKTTLQKKSIKKNNLKDCGTWASPKTGCDLRCSGKVTRNVHKNLKRVE